MAAYLYLPRGADAAVRTEHGGPGLRVDYDASGNALGIEITAPGVVTLESIDEPLERLGQEPLPADVGAPPNGLSLGARLLDSRLTGSAIL